MTSREELVKSLQQHVEQLQQALKQRDEQHKQEVQQLQERLDSEGALEISPSNSVATACG
jgi:exonuclease VII large subunit